MKRKLPTVNVVRLGSLGVPANDRKHARHLFAALVKSGVGFHSVFGDGPMMMSDIPVNLRGIENKNKEVILGIDEAGRGSVLGPMTYGCAFWSLDKDEEMCQKGFDDSKALTSEKRYRLFESIENTPEVGYLVRVLHASEISRKMLRQSPYNLNEMSHDTAMDMIRAVLNAGLNLVHCYIDTVGIPEAYQAKLERNFANRGVKFTVCKKADSIYKTCSAASIAAKVARDEMVENWKFSETNYDAVNGISFGSGYPSDPKCKEWLAKNMADPVFCFPDVVRFSWAPIANAIKEKAVKLKWEADDDDDDIANDQNQTSMSSFMVSSEGSQVKKTRLGGLPVTNNFQLVSASDFI